jgi:uncharacterized protein with HEPN domain
VLEAIERIEKHDIPDRDALERDELIQVWILYHLQIVGEAASAWAPALRGRFPEVPWGQIIGMRNVLVHQYFGIDLDLVWSAVKKELPVLREQVRSILSHLDSEGS